MWDTNLQLMLPFALDVAASTFFDGSSYNFNNSSMSSSELISYYEDLVSKYPIISIEDAMAEDDFSGWISITQRLNHKIQLVGDDIFVTNPSLIKSLSNDGIANAVLIKPNQIGSLSLSIDAIRTAHASSFNSILSHRSGDTSDSSISHLAVALNCGQIKSGSMSRSERLEKYNELLRIEEDLGSAAVFRKIF